jgi:hypothetical protein
MIDRTTFDLRLAEHRAATARVDASGWRSRAGTPPRPARAALAAARAALAARLDRASRASVHIMHRQPGHDAA